MGRNLRETLPVTNKYLQPQLPNHEEVREHLKLEKERQKVQYDRAHRVKPLTQLRKGERVWIVNESKEGKIIRQGEEPRSYWVQTEDEPIRRNRKHLQPLPAKDNNSPILQQQNESQDQQEQRLTKSQEDTEGKETKRQIKKPKYLSDYVC